MDVISRLESVEAIKKLKARYFRCVDTRDWAGFRDVFAADCAFELAEIDVDSPDDLIALLQERLHGTLTVHHGHMPEIEIEEADKASGIWAFFDIIQRQQGSEVPSIEGYGHYHEEYKRVEGEWRISRVRISRLKVRVTEHLSSPY